MIQPTLWRPDPVNVRKRAHRILDVAVRWHEPVAVFGMFSGGHDSLCATDLASRHPAFTAAVHINTGIGIEQTREFVRETAGERGWPLLEYRAADEGQDYREIVKEHGFPGPHGHRFMYTRLKERAVRRLVREHKRNRGDRVVLVTGVRQMESSRRMGAVEPIQQDGATVWTAPIIDWSGTDKNAYMAERELPRNEVVDLLHMSGECLCGAFAKPGELEWISRFFPDAAATIYALEDEVRECGQAACRWGQPPPKPVPENQTSLPLCHSCEARNGGGQTCENGHPCRCEFSHGLQLSAECCVHGEKECHP